MNMPCCFIIVFPCLGRKESDSHDKRLVEFGKCHVVQPASRNVIAEQTLYTPRILGG